MRDHHRLELTITIAGIRSIGLRIVDALPEAVRDSRAHGMVGATLTALERLELAAPLLAAAKKPTPDSCCMRTPQPRKLDHDGRRETVRAGWIVGSDGGRSTVRKALEPDFQGRASGLSGLICECDLDWERSRDIWWTWHGYDGLTAVIFNDFTGQWHVLVMERGARGAISKGSESALICKRLRDYSGDPNMRLSNVSKVDETTTSDRIARHFVNGRAILMGDAAHLFAGAAGHGIRGAVDDALNLGWKLALTVAGGAAPDLLRTYEIERRFGG